jgi:hypothetical protein
VLHLSFSSLIAVKAGQAVYPEIGEKHTYKTYEGHNHNPCIHPALPDACMENSSIDKPGDKRPCLFRDPSIRPMPSTWYATVSGTGKA